MRLAKPAYLGIAVVTLAVVLASCGGGGDGDDGALELLPPGDYASPVSGSFEFEVIEPGVSRSLAALQETQVGQFEGNVFLTSELGGALTIHGPQDFLIDITTESGSGTARQNPETPSTGRTGLDGTELDLNLEFDIPGTLDIPPFIGANDDAIFLTSPEPLTSGSEFRIATPADWRGGLRDADGNRIALLSEFRMTINGLVRITAGTPQPGATNTPIEPPPESILPPPAGGIMRFFGVGPGDEDKVFCDTDPPNDQIFADPALEPGFTPAFTDIDVFCAALVTRTQDVAQAFDTFLPCGDVFGESQVVCSGLQGPLSQESYLFVANFDGGVIPNEPDRPCTFAVITNNGTPWQPQGFEWDFFQGGGLWTQLGFGLVQGWVVFTQEVSSQHIPEPAETNARGYVLRHSVDELSAIVLDIPAPELEGADGWRITADCNDQFQAPRSGGDVAPGADPTGILAGLPKDEIELFKDGVEAYDACEWAAPGEPC